MTRVLVKSRGRAEFPGLVRLCLAAGVLVLVGCSDGAPPAPPVPEVSAMVVEMTPLSSVVEVPGRLQAVRTAEVRARVDGIVQRRIYDEGTDVRAGDVLFQIDPRELRAELSAAEASLARAEATAANAEQDVTRYEGLVDQQAISAQEYDGAVAKLRTARADVAQARAQVETAGLNLAYATVTAPIAGRAGRAAVTEGALVNGASGTLLTRIDQLDPIFVNFSQSGADLLALRRQAGAGEQMLAGVTVRLVLADGTVYEAVGRLDFLDLSIDEATGTTALRAEFPNPDRLLLPGQFVRVRIESTVSEDGVLVPQRAVTMTPTGATVLVVGADDVVESRPVTVGAMRGGAWEVKSGLVTGERVIVDGQMLTLPGSPVRAVIAAPDTVPPVVASPDTPHDDSAHAAARGIR